MEINKSSFINITWEIRRNKILFIKSVSGLGLWECCSTITIIIEKPHNNRLATTKYTIEVINRNSIINS